MESTPVNTTSFKLVELTLANRFLYIFIYFSRSCWSHRSKRTTAQADSFSDTGSFNWPRWNKYRMEHHNPLLSSSCWLCCWNWCIAYTTRIQPRLPLLFLQQQRMNDATRRLSMAKQNGLRELLKAHARTYPCFAELETQRKTVKKLSHRWSMSSG